MQALKGNKTPAYQDALLLEKKGELKEAVIIYKALHKEASQNIKILTRLMIVFRRLKDAVNEIKYINAAIKVHDQYYATSRTHTYSKTIVISKKLNLLLGHTDKKGKPLLKPAELMKLKMRKKRLQDRQ